MLEPNSTSAPTPLPPSSQSSDSPAGELLASSSAGKQRRILWIDGVGGYLLVSSNDIVIGQALSGSPVSVPIVGDLSRQAAAIIRSGSDYLLQPLQSTRLDGAAVQRPQLLHSGHTLQLGERVKLKFTVANRLSATARLDLVSHHRFKPSVDGVLLMADSCLLGATNHCHIVCPNWSQEVQLYRHQENWFFRLPMGVTINGQPSAGKVPLVSGMRVQGEDFSLSIE